MIAGDAKPQQIIERFKARFGITLDEVDLYPADPSADARQGLEPKSARPAAAVAEVDADALPRTVREILVERVRLLMRQELTDLEQFVLVQIFDQSWKDHLYAMDMLKSGIGLQAFAERDPRVLYKKEGYQYFQEMMAGIRDKVTDLIFRARVVGQAESRSNYRETEAVHEDAGSYGVAETRALPAEAADAGQSSGGGAVAQAEAVKSKPIVRDEPKIGRNDPCPCGSGKKYKKCHGANAA